MISKNNEAFKAMRARLKPDHRDRPTPQHNLQNHLKVKVCHKPQKATTVKYYFWPRVVPVPPRGQEDGAPNTDQPVFVASISSASDPISEFPLPFRPGDQTATEARPGATARMPPPTPLFPGRPT